MRKMMEAANIWLPLIGSLLVGGFAAAAWYGGNKIAAIWIGFAGCVCLLLLLALELQQWAKTNEAENQKSPEKTSADRPWISVGDPIVASPLRFLPVGATVTLRFPVRHTGGPNPALNFSLQAELIASTPERSAPHLERERFVKQLKERPDGLVFGERSLFQGDATFVEQSFLVPQAEVEQAAALLADTNMKRPFLPIFVACAVYKLVAGGERHYTCIVGDLHKANPANLSQFFDMSVGDVPAHLIQAPQLYASYVD
jgi:hypothetical protein